MPHSKSLDGRLAITLIVHDALNTVHGVTTRTIRNTVRTAQRRFDSEGWGFLTKTLPALGKALDKALLGQTPLDCLRFRKIPGTQLPLFCGELFKRVFDDNGWVLQNPCTTSARSLRDITYCFYKYELPSDPTLEIKAIETFIQTEEEVKLFNARMAESAVYDPYGLHRDPSLGGYGLSDAGREHPCQRQLAERMAASFNGSYPDAYGGDQLKQSDSELNEFDRHLLRMRSWLENLLGGFDPYDIEPKHGPGAVATREEMEEKYVFKRINPRIQQHYPFDRFFMTGSLSEVADRFVEIQNLDVQDCPARIACVPKDSRGPRIISLEPLENQWIQQGIMRKLVEYIENHPLTRGLCNFTDQSVNQKLALSASRTGSHATLDLKEASDRVSLGLFISVFPERFVRAALSVRSKETTLPDGQVISLQKYAPMGSSLCFPVLALTAMATLAAAGVHARREPCYVYGDDIIVPGLTAQRAIDALQLVGFAVNKEKSCTRGFFRESCGCDALNGTIVTPFRLRTDWESSQSAAVYSSYLSYGTNATKRGYRRFALYIADLLASRFPVIPVTSTPEGNDEWNSYGVSSLYLEPSNQARQHHPTDTVEVGQVLKYLNLIVPSGDWPRVSPLWLLKTSSKGIEMRAPKSRWNSDLQRLELKLPTVQTRLVERSLPGWVGILSTFARGFPQPLGDGTRDTTFIAGANKNLHGFSVVRVARGTYTKRGETYLSYTWR